MKIFVLNVRGLESFRAFQILHQHLQEHLPDIIFLSETISSQIQMEKLRVKFGFVGKLVVEKEGRSGGLGLFWSNKVYVSLLSFSRFHIDVRVQSHFGKNWRFIGFYGHPDASQRMHSWTLMRRLHSMYQLPWLIAGDFNEIIYSFEKIGGLIRFARLMSDFRDVLDDCALEDLGFRGNQFT
ncbi:hypothetical protein ACOSQ2_010231 [Xanthoceras sorbifolium]